MNEFMGKECQRSSERQLEDILQDPNANWTDIRQAMKSHAQTACTNTALMIAIASGLSSNEAVSTLDGVPPAAAPMVQSLTPSSGYLDQDQARTESENEQCLCLGDGYNEYVVPTYHEPSSFTNAVGPDKSNKRQPRRSTASLRRSINSMDFGVDNILELEDDCSKHSRSDSFVSNYTCDSEGFMGWHNDNDESTSKSETTNLSSYCDHDGFLTWDHSSSAVAARRHASGTIASVMVGLDMENDDSHATKKSPRTEQYEGSHCNGSTMASDDFKKPINLFSLIARRSTTACSDKDATSIGGSDLESEESQTQRKSWHIEDYEGCFNDSVPTLASTDSKSSMTFMSLVSRRKQFNEPRLSGSATKEPGLDRKEPLWKKKFSASDVTSCSGLRSSTRIETFELNEVKQALLNVRSNSSYSRTKTASNTPVINQSLGVNRDKPTYSTGDVSRHIQPLNSTNSLSYATKHSMTGKQEGKFSGILSFQRPNEEKQTRVTPKISPVTFSSGTNHDTREAIWIKRTDGGVDIKKECRKLYLGGNIHGSDNKN